MLYSVSVRTHAIRSLGLLVFCYMYMYITFHELSLGCTEEETLVAAKMQYLSRQINQLKEEVEERKLDTRSAI